MNHTICAYNHTYIYNDNYVFVEYIRVLKLKPLCIEEAFVVVFSSSRNTIVLQFYFARAKTKSSTICFTFPSYRFKTIS